MSAYELQVFFDCWIRIPVLSGLDAIGVLTAAFLDQPVMQQLSKAWLRLVQRTDPRILLALGTVLAVFLVRGRFSKREYGRGFRSAAGLPRRRAGRSSTSFRSWFPPGLF